MTANEIRMLIKIDEDQCTRCPCNCLAGMRELLLVLESWDRRIVRLLRRVNSPEYSDLARDIAKRVEELRENIRYAKEWNDAR